MVNYLKSLSKKYDSEIRKKCDKIKTELDNCLFDNFNDEFVCNNIIKSFKECIYIFDKSFREKYKI